MSTSVLLAVLVVIVISCLCYFVPLAQAKWREWHDDLVEETEVDDVVEETEVDDNDIIFNDTSLHVSTTANNATIVGLTLCS